MSTIERYLDFCIVSSALKNNTFFALAKHISLITPLTFVPNINNIDLSWRKNILFFVFHQGELKGENFILHLMTFLVLKDPLDK